MKSISSSVRNFLCGLALCALAENARSQGFNFGNFGVNGGARTPVYGPEAGNPYQQLWGNPPDASPPGTQTYSGQLLLGNNYRVQGWYSLTPVSNPFALIDGATPVLPDSLTFFGTSNSPGFFIRGEQFIPGASPSPPGSEGTHLAYLQIRSWDDRNGQYASWDEAWNAAQAGSGNAVGWSKTFAQPLAIGTVPYPGMMNFESFNLFNVPEPSLTVLAVLGGAVLFASVRIRRRHRHRR